MNIELPSISIWQIFYNLGFFGIIIGAFAWLTRSLFSQYLNKEIEKHKHELSLQSLRFQIEYTNVHIEIIGSIKKIISYVNDTQEKLEYLVDPLQGNEWVTDGREIEFLNSIAILKNEFSFVKLLISKEVCEKVETFIDKIMDIQREMLSARLSAVYPLSKETSESPVRKWHEAFRRAKNEIPTFRKELEDELRKLLIPKIGQSNQ